LRDADALLILDNCEHLIEQAARVAARLVREAPLVRILATSREALRVEAEAIVPLDGLAHADAVDLFLARARSADRRLTIDEDARAQAGRIAEALDGLPLAIELAAARVRIDGLRGIAEDALRVVHGALGPRDRSQRSQTIGASIAWSVERLDPAARTLFARLGAFAGSFEAGDAAAVDLDASGALDRLLDRSLLVRRDPFDVGLRMLSPVRADARRRLEIDPQREAVLDAHAERIRTRTLELLALCGGEGGAGAEARLDTLAADIDVALERLFGRPDPGAALDLVYALSSHWAARGARVAAAHWLARAEAHATDDRRRGDIYYARSRFAHDGAGGTDMLRLGEAARDAYARAGALGGEARAWNVIGSALIDLQRRDEARGALDRSLALQREVGDEFGIAIALINLGNIAAEVGDLEAALRSYEECAPVLDRVSTTQARIKVQNNIAYVRNELGDRAGSLLATTRAVALAESSENAAMIAFAASNAAIRFAKHGEYERAIPLARRVGELDHAPERYLGYALIARALAAQARGQEPQTRRLAAAARLLARNYGAYEDEEAGLLMLLPGSADDAIDRDAPAVRALLLAGD
jgi:predicted ATPase